MSIFDYSINDSGKIQKQWWVVVASGFSIFMSLKWEKEIVQGKNISIVLSPTSHTLSFHLMWDGRQIRKKRKEKEKKNGASMKEYFSHGDWVRKK